jgi:VWFA-related protein
MAVSSTVGLRLLDNATSGRTLPLFFGTPAVYFALVLIMLCVLSRGSAQEQPEEIQPKSRIDFSSVGFRSLSASARLASQANLSLDFLGDHRALLTFNPKKMFTRLPNCPPTHDDRLIHAVLFEVPSGKIIKESDWYMHDHQRYLWPLGSGKLLLRRLNDLYLLDSDLHEKLLLSSPKPFLWISVTPDGKQIIVERRQDETPGNKAKTAAAQVKPKVQIEFLDAENLSVQRVIKSEGIVNLEALSTGFTDVIHGFSGKVWLVRFGPSGKQRENITRVRSKCVPDVMFPSGNTILVGRCAMNSSDYSVSAFTVTGHLLWRQHWPQHRYATKIQRSEDGSRIAVSSIARVVVPASESTEAGEGDDDTDKGLQQRIQVLDTASGSRVLSLTVTPAAMMAQNVSLSPDGRRLLLSQGSNVEIYDLPEMSQEELAKYVAAKSDVPGLYAAAGGLPSTTTPDEETFSSVDAAEEAAREQKSPDAAPPTTASSQTTPVPATTTPAVATAAPAITFKNSTRVVVEDVVVTDGKGHPVKGLRREDFQLTEDGKAQTVKSFEEFPPAEAPSGGEKLATAAPAENASSPAAPSAVAAKPEPSLPANIYTNSVPSGPETGSATIIVLDLLNTPVPDQQRAREQLIKFIQKQPKASQIALCSLSSNLRLIQGFTHDENALIAAVRGKKGGVKAPPWQSDSGMERSVQLARDVALVAGTSESIQALQRAQNTLDEENAHDLDVRMRFTLDAFTQLARYLSGVPGRKNLIWLSGSFPLNIFPNPDVSEYQPVTRNYEIQIKKATNLLAEAHVAVYPVSVKGAETQAMFNASNSGTYDPPAFAGSNGPSHPGPTTSIANTSESLPLSSRMERETRSFRETIAGEQGTMEQVAADTGGKAFYNSNGIEDAIKTAVDEGSHYYTLSYTPANRKYDGAFRKVKVTLGGKGYQLAYRRGYYAEDPDSGAWDTRAPAQRVGIAAMQQGSPQSRQIVFATRVVPIGKPVKSAAIQPVPAKKKGGPNAPVEMQHYGVDYAVDASTLRFGATASGAYHAVLSFMVTAFNDDGRLMASLVSTATSDLTPANYKEVMQGGFRIHQEFDVPVDAVSLRLGVEDASSSHVGTLEIPLPVPVPPDAPQVATRSLPPIEPD